MNETETGYASTGGAVYKVYELSNGSVRLVKHIESVKQYPSHSYKYYLNGQEITGNAFENEYRAIWNWPKVDFLK